MKTIIKKEWLCNKETGEIIKMPLRWWIENYGIKLDYDLHKEVLERYKELGLKPYGGFMNPEITPVTENGKVVEYTISYPDNYLEQMLEYGRKYSTL